MGENAMTSLALMNDLNDLQTSTAVLARRGVQQGQQATTVKECKPQRLLTDPQMLPFNLPSGRFYLMVPQPVPTWLPPMLDTLMQFAWMPANWDTYGGVPLTSKAVFTALDVISRLMSDASISPASVPTSEGFGDTPDGSHMSVAIRDEIVGGVATFLANCPGCGIAEFTAGHARHTCHMAIARDPVPGEPWHAIVIGKKKKQSIRRSLRDGCQVVVKPRES